MNERDFDELAAGHALHALSPEDETAYLDALQEHPEWAQIASADAATAASLADTVGDVAPPAALRADLIAQITATPQETPGQPPVQDDRTQANQPPTSSDQANEPDASSAQANQPPTLSDQANEAPTLSAQANQPDASSVQASEPAPDTETIQTIERRRWTRGLLALAASFVLLLGLGFGAAFIGQQLTTPAEIVALQQIEAAPDAQSATIEMSDGGVATAHWSGQLGKAVLVSNGLPTISDDQSFELWFVRDDGTPVAAGVFAAGADGDATAVLDGSMQAGDTIAVTVEQAGGSPTGKPTTDPILAIPTA